MLLMGSARQTQAAIIAELTARLAALEGEIKAQPEKATKAKAEMPAFRTKAQRAAGKGWPCVATDGKACERKDLRTFARSQSHDDAGHTPRVRK